MIALAQSLLNEEKIDYLIRGGGPRPIFGIGRATGYEFGMGAAQFWVRADDAERVKVLLEDLSAADPQSHPPDVTES